ncbi:NTP transferase domain-containing protein [Flammeovirga sp. SubArs3]|uniref:NTP transferase domain-containing protein n=1 Tax=Flammeovirga sp. SubArs3 TaxID=2995316 RepID=UPI00248AFC5A|nr:NTP transferase domain-containing protein [Flammeovirga sp. SubArs3]
MKHQKHAKMNRRTMGNFAPNEVAIMGTTCGDIKSFVGELTHRLSRRNPAFLDMDHKSDEEELNKSILGDATTQVTDKVNFHRIDALHAYNDFEKRKFFHYNDLVFVNGNHYKAAKQLLFIDDRKPLIKKLAKITNPICVIFSKGVNEIPEELLSEKPELKNLPHYSLDDEDVLDSIATFLDKTFTTPPLKGLVLTGGKSTRMGEDKSVLNYHGQPQWKYAKELLEKYCSEVHVSVASESDTYQEASQIADKFIGLGPMGGILSAFQNDPNAAWLVIACDLPLLSEHSLDQLVSNRNSNKVATSFKSPTMDFPEPLICIWEPKAYGTLLEYLSWGYSCPRKALINSDIELLIADKEEEMVNANTKEDFNEIKAKLK